MEDADHFPRGLSSMSVIPGTRLFGADPESRRRLFRWIPGSREGARPE
jgi:hypothetical protein